MGNEQDFQQEQHGPESLNKTAPQRSSGGLSMPAPHYKAFATPNTPHTTQQKSSTTAQLKDPPDKKIRFQVPIDGVVTGAELIERVEWYIYKERVNHTWSLAGTPINPTQTYGTKGKTTLLNVNVSESLYRQHRTQTQQGVGVDITEAGTVNNSDEHSKEFAKLPQPQQDALNAEIQRRFKKATGKDAKTPETEGIWNVIRDEVLAQHAKVNQLSDQAKLLIKPVDQGGIQVSPQDYPELIRLIQQIDGSPPALVQEYASRTTAQANNLAELKQSLERFHQEQKERGDNKDKRTELENRLFGSNGVQDDLSTFHSMALTEGMTGVPTGVSLTYYESADKKAKELGFKDVAEYDQYIKDYIHSFQQEAVKTGVGLLQKYEHMLYQEEQRYLNTEDAQQLGDAVAKSGAKQKYEQADQAKLSAFLMGIPSGPEGGQVDLMAQEAMLAEHRKGDRLQQEATATMQTFQPGHPLLQDPAFELEELAHQDPSKTKAYLLKYIAEQRQKIAEVKVKMQSDQEYVFTLDNLMKHMYDQENLSPSSVPYKAIQEHISDIKLKDALIGIGIAILAISLGLLSGGSGTVGTLAAVGSVGLGIYDVTREFQQYTEQQNAHDVGLLSKDPTFAWVVLAMVGAGLDFAAVAKLLPALKAPVETFEATAKADPAKALQELDTNLSKIKELDEKMKANILKRAENRAAYTKKKQAMKGAMRCELIPYSSDLLEWAIYAAKDGVTRAQDLFIWLQRNSIISDTLQQAGLSATESRALAIAIDSARRGDEFVTSTLKPNLLRRTTAEPDTMVDVSTRYADEDLALMVGYGRGLGVSDANIEDVIFNACRKKKSFTRNELMAQMSTWKKVEQQGFPTIFKTQADYQQFTAVIHDVAKKWGLPTDKIMVQGSSLKIEDISQIDDIDIAILVDDATFQQLIKRFVDGADNPTVKRNIATKGAQGKIAGRDIKGDTGNLIMEFYTSFERAIGKNFTEALGVRKIQISVINEGGKLEVGPFLQTN